MVDFMKVNGKMENNMVEENMFYQMENKNKEFECEINQMKQNKVNL